MAEYQWVSLVSEIGGLSLVGVAEGKGRMPMQVESMLKSLFFRSECMT